MIVDVRRGETVALNIKKRLYFFQGDGGLNLTAGKEDSAVIPQSISDQQLDAIKKAVTMQHLVVLSAATKQDNSSNVQGKEKTEDDLEKILNKGRNAVKDYIYNLLDNKDLSSDEKIAILEKFSEIEKLKDNRKSVLDSIDAALDKLAGISPVQETEKESVQIQLSQ